VGSSSVFIRTATDLRNLTGQTRALFCIRSGRSRHPQELAPIHEAALIRGKQQCRVGDLVRFAEAAKRRGSLRWPLHLRSCSSDAANPGQPGVDIAPGTSTFTLIRRGARSKIQPRANVRIAALLALYR
jgi:hypothetical protein